MSIDKITPEEWDAKTELTKEQMETEDKCDFQGDVEDLDMVNKPPHYNQGTLEAIDYIKQQLGPLGYRSYLEGTAIKYLHRYKYKQSNIQDLEKCVWYINRLKKELTDM